MCLVSCRPIPPCPACDPRRHWNDVISADLQHVSMSHSGWYSSAQDQLVCRASALVPSLSEPVLDQSRKVSCGVCRPSFHRPADKARYKCIAECKLPVQGQQGAVQCTTCLRWFLSKGGLMVHRCLEPEAAAPTPSSLSTTQGFSAIPSSLLCPVCQRQFKSVSGFKRHKCHRNCCATKADRTAFGFHCEKCRRQFRRRNDLTRHLRFCSEQ